MNHHFLSFVFDAKKSIEGKATLLRGITPKKNIHYQMLDCIAGLDCLSRL